MKLRNIMLALALALPLSAIGENQDQLVKKYTPIAGSTPNAISLVSGLRDGKEVELRHNGSTETFTPPTGKMGYGNVDHALALAEASLKQQGITHPTPLELEAAVMHILTMRAEGQGWGQIAQAKGFKLGELKRPEHAGKAERVAKAERAHKPERPQKPERPERAGRPEKPQTPR